MNLLKHGSSEFLCNAHLIQQHAIVHRVAERINRKRNVAYEIRKGMYSFENVVAYHTDIVRQMIHRGLNHTDPLRHVNVSDKVWKAYRDYPWDVANRTKQAICECPKCLINYLYNRQRPLIRLTYEELEREIEFPDQIKWKVRVNSLVYRYKGDQEFRKMYGRAEGSCENLDAFAFPPQKLIL